MPVFSSPRPPVGVCSPLGTGLLTARLALASHSALARPAARFDLLLLGGAEVAGAVECRAGRRRVIGRRGGALAGVPVTRRRRRRWGGKAAAGAGVVDVDRAGVLGQEARRGGEEGVAPLGGGVDEFCVGGAFARGDQADAAARSGDVGGEAFFAVPAAGQLPLIDIGLAVGVGEDQRFEAFEEDPLAVFRERVQRVERVFPAGQAGGGPDFDRECDQLAPALARATAVAGDTGELPARRRVTVELGVRVPAALVGVVIARHRLRQGGAG